MEYTLHFETEHFKLLYQKADEGVAIEYKDIVQNAYNRIVIDCGFLPHELDEKIHFYICKNVVDYLYFTNKKREEYQNWMVGYSDYDDRRICMLSPKAVIDYPVEELKNIIAHEITHMVFDTYCGVINGEAWISEGVALLYGEQIYLNYVDVNAYPKISEIAGKCIDGDTPDQFVNNFGYDYAGIYVWYFIKKYGFEKFLLAYKNELILDEYIWNGYEKEAIDAYIEFTGKN